MLFRSVTYEQNRRSITVTNIYGYGLLVGPAERADTIVDFSAYAGQTLILYNDAPSPTPFTDPRNDYFTGDPDQTAQGGAYSTQPGYGPNTRTIMQIKVGTAVTSGGPLKAAALATALPAAYGASQPAPLVTESVYNAAYGTNDIDTYGRVATGSAAQPTLIFGHTGNLALTGISLVSSGGAGTGSGTGYVTAPAVQIVGGGGTGATATATVDPATHQVNSISLTSAGTGYTSIPSVIFVPGSTVAGVTISDGGSGYTQPVAVNFTGGGGTGAAATVTLSTASSLLPAVTSLSGGAGYVVPPTVSFTGGNGSGAAATATLTSSAIASAITMSNIGAGYSAGMTATASAPQIAGGVTALVAPVVGFALASTTINATTVGTAYDQLSTVVTVSQPNLAGGTQATGTANFDPISGGILSVTISGGSGYTAPATVVVSDNVSNLALGVLVAGVANTVAPSAVIPNAALAPATGQVFGVNVTNAGTGYTVAPTIKFADVAGGTGGGAVATTALAGPAGSVSGVTITATGGAYSAAPTVVFTPAAGSPAPTTAAAATVALATSVGTITGITMTNPGTGYTSAPAITFTTAAGAPAPTAVAAATAGIAASGTGAQAMVSTSTSSSIPVLTKAEQELYDDWGRYNSTGGVELPLTLAGIQTTVPLNYIDAPTDFLGDDEVQIWKLVDNGFWSNSIHFSMNDVQLINRVGWDGTVKAPASNEVGWKDTVRLNPLEDAIVAVRGKATNIPFSLPRSNRLQDPSLKAGVSPGSGLGFTADPAVVSTVVANAVAGGKAVPVGTVLLSTSANTNVFPGSPAGNYDNEFIWGSGILGHAENDFTRPVVFSPIVVTPNSATTLADTLGNGTLTWTDPTPTSTPLTTLGNVQNELGFKILQAPETNGAPSGAFTLYTTIPANSTKWVEPAALVTKTPPYFAYEVVGYNVAGDALPSNVWVEGPPTAPTLPQAPVQMLTPSFITTPAATSTSDVKVAVAWQDNANNETNYIITRTGPGVLANGKVTGGTTTTFTAPANPVPPSTNTIFADAGPLVELGNYEYDVVARNSFGDSTPVLVGTMTAPVSMPLVPTGLASTLVVAAPCPVDTVTKAVVPTQCKPDNVSLTWTDNAFNETGYNVLRDGVQIGTVAATALNVTGTTLTYVDATAAEGVNYNYTVQAVNSAGTATSAALPVTMPQTAPTLPTNLAAVPATGLDANGAYLDTVALTWSDNAYNENTYQVFRDGVQIATVAGNNANNPMGTATTGWTSSPIMSYTDVNSANGLALSDGSTHTWTVTSVNATGNTVSAGITKTMPGIVIAAPSALVAAPNRAGSSIALTWRDNSNNEKDFLVEEQTSTSGAPGTFGAWTNVMPVIARTAAQTTAVGGLVTQTRNNIPTTVGLVYNFRVSARSLPSDSPYAFVQASLLAPAVPAAPVLALPTVVAAGAGAGRVNLAWNAVAPQAGTTISYIVTINGVATPVAGTAFRFRPTAAQLAAGSLTISVQSVATAIRGAGQTVYGSTNSLASNVQTVSTTAPAAPAAGSVKAAANAVGSRSITVTWTAVTGAASYTVQRATVSAAGVVGAFANVGNVTTATFTNAGLTAGTTYRYQVRANSAFGSSAFVANAANATAR